MSTEEGEIHVSGLSVEVVRKPIRNLHLGVYPPHGRVRVAAPLQVSDDAVRLAVIGKLRWIHRQRALFQGQSRQSRREMVSGESHYFLGRRYRLRVVAHTGTPRVVLRSRSFVELHVAPGTPVEEREQVLQRWYRRQLRAMLPQLLNKWQAVMGVEVASCGIKKMKTRWGSCNADSARIWINLELVKKPVQCLEYILVHEMTHLLERHHNARFHELMDGFLPLWRQHREELNRAPLAHDDWDY
jgi:predicted metal-dependent hydrolase